MTLEEFQKKVVEFRDKRNWKQFHNPKDMALSLTLEATEVLELFQWKNEEEMKEYIKKNKQDISDELVDCLYWVLLMAHDFDIDLNKSFIKKMIKNNKKYPIKKSKNSSQKYTRL